LEADWLGPWKGLLFGQAKEEKDRETVKKAAVQLRKELKTKHKVIVNQNTNRGRHMPPVQLVKPLLLQVTIDVFLSEYLLDHYSILSEEHISTLLPSSSSSPAVLDLLQELAPPAAPARFPALLLLDQVGSSTKLLACIYLLR